MDFLKYLYVTEAQALSYGLTHEGTLYGIPVWIGDVDNPESFLAIPKIPALVVWTAFASGAMQFLVEHFRNDESIETPLTVGRDIRG